MTKHKNQFGILIKYIEFTNFVSRVSIFRKIMLQFWHADL